MEEFTMRKAFMIVLILSMFSTVVSAYADVLGGRTIGDEVKLQSVEPIRFEDVTIGKTYKIANYATVSLVDFKFINKFAQYKDGRTGKSKILLFNGHFKNDTFSPIKTVDEKFYSDDNINNINYHFIESGNGSQFAWLEVEIQNLQMTPVSFMKDISINVIYDDEYEYNGWVKQLNYDYRKSESYMNRITKHIDYPICLSPVDEIPINPMYKGHYALGCTLPNFIVKDKKSQLRMIIKLGKHELTYNIRKVI